MNWTKDKSVKLSLVCIWLFAVVLLFIDVSAVNIGTYVLGYFIGFFNAKTLFIAWLYLGSICGWICLWFLRKLLKNIQCGEVFTTENTRFLRIVSWCCAGAAFFSFGLGLIDSVFNILAFAAFFMMLIVRIVKNAFQQAMDMKSELDLTI